MRADVYFAACALVIGMLAISRSAVSWAGVSIMFATLAVAFREEKSWTGKGGRVGVICHGCGETFYDREALERHRSPRNGKCLDPYHPALRLTRSGSVWTTR